MKLISSRRCSWLLSLSRAGYYGGHNTRKVFLLSFVLVLFRAGYHGGMIGNNTGKVLFLFPIFYSCSYFLIIRILFLSAIFFVIALVLGRSQVIALRGSYSDGCKRKQIRWSLV
jgi:hypothetical protein